MKPPPPETGPGHYYITINGKLVHYVIVGSGPPLILIHAGGTSWRDWERIIPILERNYTVIALDMPGAGDSEELNGTHNIENYVSFIKDFIDVLGLSKSKVRIMGMSFGGMIALRFSLAHQDQVDRLVLLEVARLYAHPERRPVLALLSVVAQNDFSRETTKWWIYYLGQTGIFLPFDLEIGSGFLKSSSRATIEILLSWSEMDIPREVLKRLKIPVLLLAAENDKEIPPHAVKELTSLLPNAEIIVVPGFSHYNFGKENLGAGGIVDESILKFLSDNLSPVQ